MDALSIAIQEMERSAGEAGRDNSGADVARYFGQPSDIIAWHRGAPGSWFGHVGLVESYDLSTETMTTIEGNATRFPCRVTRKTYRRAVWSQRLYGVARL